MKQMTTDEIKKVQLDILIYVDKICKDNNIKYSLAYGTLIGAIRHKGFIPWDDDIDIVLKRSEYERLLEVLYKDDNSKYMIFSMKDEGYFYPYAKVGDLDTIIREKNWPDIQNLGVNIDVFPVDYVPEGKEREYYDKTQMYINCLYNCLTDIAYVHNRRIVRIIKKILRFKIVKKCRKKSEWYWKDKINEMTQIKDSKVIECIVDIKHCPWAKRIMCNYKGQEFEKHMFSAVEDYHEMLKSYYGDYMKLPPENERESYHDFIAYWK